MHTPLDKLSDASDIWIYQCERILNKDESDYINSVLEKFKEEWQSHGRPVHNDAILVNDLFIVIVADTQSFRASGCSIDTSVEMVRNIGANLHVDFFNRLNLCIESGEGIQILNIAQLQKALSENVVNADTLIYDNTVRNLGDFKNSWLRPLGQSWARRYLHHVSA